MARLVYLEDLLDIAGAALAYRLAATEELREQSLAVLDDAMKRLVENLPE